MGRPWLRIEELRLASLRRAGLKVAAIAARLGRTPGSVRQRLVRLRVVVRPPQRPNRPAGSVKRRAVRMLLAGASNTEVAERLGVYQSAVSRYRKGAGLPPTDPAERTRRAWATRRVSCQAATASAGSSPGTS